MKFNHLKALVVDDDEAVQLIVNNRLNSIGVKSTIVSTGTEAIKKLSSEPFDFIIMDISMPEQDGIDAARWIRDLDDDKRKDIPIFALTSYSTKEHTQEIIDAGFNAHLVKPLQLENLVALLEKYFLKK
ncbi:MAG: response regulator [Flammeovirgaceae bacterium]|nr:response regulator [Flammeovirgaceae bacterium]